MGLSSGWGSNWRGAFTHERRMAELDRQWQAWTEAGITVVRVDMADPMAWNTPARVAEDLARDQGAVSVGAGVSSAHAQRARHGDAVGL